VMEHDPHLANGTTRIKSPTTTVGRGMPSPVHMRSDNRSVSPLSHNESIFGVGNRYNSLDNDEQREQPCIALEPSRNDSLELVCDYDRSVTKLYEMLESSQWENARIRCNTHPEEVHTWVIRHDANGKTRWKLLPLHAAVIFQTPLSLIENLLMQHPIAAAKRDDQGILPLHLAFRHKSNEAVIETLLHQYPSAVIIKDYRERFPLDHGKDMQFSAKLMGLYAETFNKCQPIETNTATNKTEITVTYENRINALKQAYEARIDAMVKDHEQKIEDTKSKAEDQARKNRERHGQEIEKIESLLAIEMMSEKKSPEVQAELQGLSSTLADATRELTALKKIVEEQNNDKTNLIDELRQTLKDQTTLHDRCNKQQEQLDQAQKLREQLLRTLLQKEDGKPIQVSNEICQISDNNIARTKKLLSNLSMTHSKCAIEEHSEILPSRNHHHNTDDLLSDPPNPSTTAALPAEPDEDHGDDISAITESSYLQPFGDS